MQVHQKVYVELIEVLIGCQVRRAQVCCGNFRPQRFYYLKRRFCRIARLGKVACPALEASNTKKGLSFTARMLYSFINGVSPGVMVERFVHLAEQKISPAEIIKGLCLSAAVARAA
jgi:hypothetical protein